jgi:pyridoxamine 5'-phosphate oxidase
MADPLRHFQALWLRVKRSHAAEPTAMTLATADHAGRPMARTVLLKGISNGGFVFFTNEQSRKGRQLADNPRAALCFFWSGIDQQVLVEGRVSRVSRPEADAYWMTRPRQSQIGAWASQQSRPLKNRAALLKRYREFERRYKGKAVPRPAYWVGFRVAPSRIEFWRCGDFRLHRRTAFTKSGRRWKATLLNP